MHNLWIFFLKKRAFTYMIMLALVGAGLYSLVTIPKESSPEVVVPIGIVSTTLRGGSAEDVERLISMRIEEEAANLENIDTVTSSSREGVSVVTVQWNASADINESLQDLKDAVDRAKPFLPTEADEPRVARINFADQPILIASISVDRPSGELPELARTLTDEMKKVRGVSKVAVSGVREREVSVIIKRSALLTYGIRVDQVVSALQSANIAVPVGTITVADVNYPINFEGTLEETNTIGDLPIAGDGAGVIRMRDVAVVMDGLARPSSLSRISVDGAPSEQSITLSVFKKEGGDVTRIARDVRERLEELRTTMLTDANIVISFDRGELVEKDLRELTRVGLETVALVMLMLLLTIGWRESIVAALSIPLSFVIAFIGLQASGNTLNFISLFSLILAVGILVDSGIVVTEAIHARQRKYKKLEDAAIASIREYAWPLIAGTMTTVAVFVPLFFISGIVGEFIASIPFTIIFVLIASVFVALGMVPLLALLLSKEHKNRLEDKQEEYAERAREWYKRALGRLLDDRRAQNIFLSIMTGGFILAMALPFMGLVRVQFFPEGDQELVYIEIERQEGTTLQETDRTIRAVEEILYTSPYVDSFVTTVGEGSSFNQNGASAGEKLGNITLMLRDDRTKTSLDIMRTLREELSGITDAKVTVDQMGSGPPSSAPIRIVLSGEDLDLLQTSSEKVERLLTEIPGTRDVTIGTREDGTRFTIGIDRDRVAEAGLSVAQVAQTIRTAVSGVTATTIRTDDESIDVVVKLDLNPEFVNPEETTDTVPSEIAQIPIPTPQGTLLLGTLIETRVEQGRFAISREDQKRIAVVTAQISGERTAIEIVNELRARTQELSLDPSVTITYGGESEDVNESFTEMGIALIAGMILMLGILVLEFNSFRYTLYLLSIIPLSLIGVMAGLAMTGAALSFPSMLGIIALAGVIINHAIILLDSILVRLRHNDEELSLRESIIEASAVRLRPIFLTTITTVIGMVPLVSASPLWGPLAYAIMFGLSFAIILTLALIPVLFYRWPGKEFAHAKGGTPKH